MYFGTALSLQTDSSVNVFTASSYLGVQIRISSLFLSQISIDLCSAFEHYTKY
jgi:hypothetical protein